MNPLPPSDHSPAAFPGSLEWHRVEVSKAYRAMVIAVRNFVRVKRLQAIAQKEAKSK